MCVGVLLVALVYAGMTLVGYTRALIPFFLLLGMLPWFYVPRPKLSPRPHWLLMILLGLFRVGEASNPGPKSHFDASFSLGAFNPSGLRNKAQFFTTHLSDGDIWAVSETHFYGRDVSKFRAGLRAADSQHTYYVTDKTSLKPCLTSSAA